MHNDQDTRTAALARLRGHVAADVARLVSAESAQLVDDGKKVTAKLSQVLAHLAPKRKEEIGEALTAFVDAVTAAIAEQSSGELFSNVHGLLATNDNDGFAVSMLSEALDMTERLTAHNSDDELHQQADIRPDHLRDELEHDFGWWVCTD